MTVSLSDAVKNDREMRIGRRLLAAAAIDGAISIITFFVVYQFALPSTAGLAGLIVLFVGVIEVLGLEAVVGPQR